MSHGVVSQLYLLRFPLTPTLSRKGRGDQTPTPALPRIPGEVDEGMMHS